MAETPKIVTRDVALKVVAGPHNGAKGYRFKDDIAGDWIGGQVAFIRSAIRYKRFVAALGRRAGKTTSRPFLWLEEANLTAGLYTAGFIAQDHTKAWEAFQFVRDQYGGLAKDGGMVLEAVGDPQTQNRYLKIIPIKQDPATIPEWYHRDPAYASRLANIGRNEGLKLYFWSGQHPHYQKIQGFMFKFHRLSLDEPAQLHPSILRIVTPMLLDSGGALDVAGIPDVEMLGNTWFKRYFDKGQDPTKRKRWFSFNFPSMSNPKLDKEALDEAVEDCLSEEDYEQAILGKFVSGKGAVFGNLNAVFLHDVRQGSDDSMPDWMRRTNARAPAPTLAWWLLDPYPMPGHQYGISVDWAGKTRTRDATIMGVYDLSSMPKPRQSALLRFTSDNYTEQLLWVQSLKDHYGAVEIHGDENNGNGEAMGDFLRQRYQTGIIAHKFGAHNKGGYVRRGQMLFYNAEIELINCVPQRHEFEVFRRVLPKESENGVDSSVRFSHPPGEHDDFVDSFLQITESLVRGRREIAVSEEQERSLITGTEGALQIATSVEDQDLWDDLQDESGAMRPRR